MQISAFVLLRKSGLLAVLGAEDEADIRRLLLATTRSFELSQALSKSGGINHLDVLDAQRSLYAVQQAPSGLHLVKQTNRLTRYKVLGGGYAS